MALPATGLVLLKMLPFDNKSEFQVVVDMPAGTPVERTAALMHELGAYLATVPEVTDYQAYAGTAAPINFNGLVRQYYLRAGARWATSRSTWWTSTTARPEPRHCHARASAAAGNCQTLWRQREGGGSAARPARALAHRGRNLWT